MRGQRRICTRISTISSLVLSMTLPVDLLAVKEAVKPQWFAPGAALAHGRREELDSPRRESLHVQDIQAFSEPVDHQVRRVGSVGPDYPSVPLLDGSRVHH